MSGQPEERDGVTLERHDDNGKVYIAWFDQASVHGFVWSGDPADPVQVQREMGEPIIATFPVQDYVPDGDTVRETLDFFKLACKRWLTWEEE